MSNVGIAEESRAASPRSRTSYAQNLSPPSGRLLAQLARQGRERPCYRLGDVAVPILTWTAEAARYRRDPLAVGVPRATALYLSADTLASNFAAEQLAGSSHAAARVRWLDAAVARDLADVTPARWAELLDQQGEHRTDSEERVIGRDVEEGRKLWISLGAWPWWAIAAAWADGQPGSPLDLGQRPLPERWWELPRVVATYEAWATGSQAPLRQARSVA